MNGVTRIQGDNDMKTEPFLSPVLRMIGKATVILREPDDRIVNWIDDGNPSYNCIQTIPRHRNPVEATTELVNTILFGTRNLSIVDGEKIYRADGIVPQISWNVFEFGSEYNWVSFQLITDFFYQVIDNGNTQPVVFVSPVGLSKFMSMINMTNIVPFPIYSAGYDNEHDTHVVTLMLTTGALVKFVADRYINTDNIAIIVDPQEISVGSLEESDEYYSVCPCVLKDNSFGVIRMPE